MTTQTKTGRPRIDVRAQEAWTRERGNVSLSKLAAALKISPAAISMWQRVPAERIEAVAASTGIPAWRLRPDLYPAPDKPVDPWNP